eukprot:SAG11_NODE_7860_length_1087_cov_0.867409_2_plen_192_part_01
MGFFSSVKRLGEKVVNTGGDALRFGNKVAGSVAQFGDKVANVASQVQSFSAPVAAAVSGVPVIGTAAGLINKGAMAVERVARGVSEGARMSEKMIGRGQSIVRKGRDFLDNQSPGTITDMAIWAERCRVYHMCVALQRLLALACHCRPYPHRLVPAPRDDLLAVRAERCRCYGISVALQRLLALARDCRPHP